MTVKCGQFVEIVQVKNSETFSWDVLYPACQVAHLYSQQTQKHKKERSFLNFSIPYEAWLHVMLLNSFSSSFMV